MVIGCKLGKDDDFNELDESQYRSMIGNLMYVIYSRPDNMWDVGMVAIFQLAPKETHALAIRCISRYYGTWSAVSQRSKLLLNRTF